jgi:hypothetical protein
MTTNALKFNQDVIPKWRSPIPTPGVMDGTAYLDYLRQRDKAMLSLSVAVLREMCRCLDAISSAGLDATDVAKAVDEECRYLITLPRAWRWWCLRDLLNQFSGCPEVFWPLFLWFGSDAESNLAHGWLRGALEYALIHESSYRYLSPENKEFLDSLPERVTIYRGVQRPSRYVGISWTLDREVAEWFAGRNTLGGGIPTLLSGHAKKSNIVAVFTGRNESEVLILPRHVRGRGEMPLHELMKVREFKPGALPERPRDWDSLSGVTLEEHLARKKSQ